MTTSYNNILDGTLLLSIDHGFTLFRNYQFSGAANLKMIIIQWINIKTFQNIRHA